MTDPDRVGVAAFDFDGTLTRRDTVVPFLERLIGRRRLWAQLGSSAPHLGLAAARRDRDRLRAIATRAAFTGLAVDELARQAATHASAIIADGLRSDTVAIVDAHRRAGHRTVIVSASYTDYLVPLAEHLGIDAVLATRVEIGADGRCTGRLHGPNCRGPEKLVRLMRWFDEAGLERSNVETWAYGDSTGDRELLADADHPVWVGRRIGSVAPTV
jgi:phosphatidylglycerophosphatase C